MASLRNVTVGVPLQPSIATTDDGSGAGTTALHVLSVTLPGHVIVGGVISTVLVIVCEQVALLPHTSVDR